MIVNRRKLSFWERLYLPAIWGGFKITLRHFFKKKVTMQYPEEKWVVPEGYRGAPYLVKNEAGRIKCVSCQLCEFVCPPKAIRITPPGPDPENSKSICSGASSVAIARRFVRKKPFS